MNSILERVEKQLAMKKQLSWNERYRQYIIEKESIPAGLTATEYEREIHRLVKKYRI